MIRQERMTVVRQEEIAKIYLNSLYKDKLFRMMNPGQFVHIRVSDSWSHCLRGQSVLQISIKKLMQFTIIYRADGRGTKLFISNKSGDEVDVLGPLGNGFPVNEAPEGETALLVGGGIGVLHCMNYPNN